MSEWETYIELAHVVHPNGLALIAELIKEEEPPESIFPDEPCEAQKRHRSHGAEGELYDGVIWAGVAGVAGGAGEEEVRRGGDGHREEEEHQPWKGGGKEAGLVDAHPPQVGAEAVELVVHVRHGPVVLAPSIQQRLLHVGIVGGGGGGGGVTRHGHQKEEDRREEY